MSYPENEYVMFVKILMMLIYLAFVGTILTMTVYGLILAFSASVILGFVTFFIQPAPLVFGVAKFFFGVNLPAMIMAWIQAHGG